MVRFLSDVRQFYRGVPLTLEFTFYNRGRLVYPKDYGVAACVYTTQLSSRFWGLSLLEGQSTQYVPTVGVTITRRRRSWVLSVEPAVLQAMPLGELHVGVVYYGASGSYTTAETITLPRLSDIEVDCNV